MAATPDSATSAGGGGSVMTTLTTASEANRERMAERQTLTASMNVEKALRERDYWIEALEARIVQHGQPNKSTHNKTTTTSIHTSYLVRVVKPNDGIANCLMHLGHAHLRCEEYSDALSVYKSCVRIRRHLCGNVNTLSVARALDKVGLAASFLSTSAETDQSTHENENLEWARVALQEALQIRVDQLGPHHIDSVETLNNLAGVYLHKREWRAALQAYREVLMVRAAVHGPTHPSVAVTLQSLGNVLLRMGHGETAIQHYQAALILYRDILHLDDAHFSIQRIHRHIIRAERLLLHQTQTQFHSQKS
jgi:tetratricopeptide (TPR) repeat protein